MKQKQIVTDMRRPSHREVDKKIKTAKTAVKEGLIYLENPIVITQDLIELGLQSNELETILLILLDEITYSDYAGYRPPQKSYKSKIIGCELFAFSW